MRSFVALSSPSYPPPPLTNSFHSQLLIPPPLLFIPTTTTYFLKNQLMLLNFFSDIHFQIVRFTVVQPDGGRSDWRHAGRMSTNGIGVMSVHIDETSEKAADRQTSDPVRTQEPKRWIPANKCTFLTF